jgi:hypothetical protein
MVVIVISAAVMVAVLEAYNRAQATAASVNLRIDSQMLPNEIIQRIAEDVDRLTSPGLDTKITIENKPDGGINLSRLTITTTFYGKGEPPRPYVFDEVIWQSDFDPLTESIVLYRLHGGVNLEDKVVEKSLLDLPAAQRELFIPVTTGITYFDIVAVKADTEYGQWKQAAPPGAVRVAISFAEPTEDMDGNLSVRDEDKITRTIAIDRTRKIRYNFVKKEFKADDPNEIGNDEAATEEDDAADITDETGMPVNESVESTTDTPDIPVVKPADTPLPRREK